MSKTIHEGDLLWTPSESVIQNSNLHHYMQWLAANHDLHFDTFDQLWTWSVTDIEAFWQSISRYFDIKFHSQPERILESREMPGAKWFPGAQLNYAENIFQHMTADRPALLYQSENIPLTSMSWQTVYDQTRHLAAALRSYGIQRGDRVASFMPNVPETIIALLATASIGAIWSSCSPDFGAGSVLDRFTQIEPKLLFAVDGYHYNGRSFDRREILAQLQQNLPTLERTIVLPRLDLDISGHENTILWDDALSTNATDELPYEPVPFDHPLWILYSSGTTGLPKPIVQGHGGIVLEHAKSTVFHNDLGSGDRFFWYTTTGWMMWNYLVGGLLSGATILLYDGSPAYPDMNALWQFAESSGMTYFGTGAAYIQSCIKAGITPNQQFDLSRIRGLGSTGSPLSVDGFQWVYENVNSELALESLSGGTDLCTAFVGGARLKSVYAGELQGASLGASVYAYDEAGQPVVNQIGELVITEPMPSMPLYFWNDDGMERYKSSYFEMYPGIWRHGDWIKINERGGCVIYGRSDATINRHGVRIGTSELYRAIEGLPEIKDSLIVDLEGLDGQSYMPLFVVMADGHALDDDLKIRIKQQIRTQVSPRHSPDEILEIKEVPYTLSGKKMEIPVRSILRTGGKTASVNQDVMRNPAALEFFYNFARELQSRQQD